MTHFYPYTFKNLTNYPSAVLFNLKFDRYSHINMAFDTGNQLLYLDIIDVLQRILRALFALPLSSLCWHLFLWTLSSTCPLSWLLTPYWMGPWEISMPDLRMTALKNRCLNRTYLRHDYYNKLLLSN